MANAAEGYLLSKRDSSESFEIWTLLTKEQGLLSFLRRLPSQQTKNKQRYVDLWDHLSLEWTQSTSSGSTGPRFVKDFKVHTHHEALGEQWETLERASYLSRMLERNLAEADPRTELFLLVEQAILALCTSVPPDAVILKLLLRWIAIEGYGRPDQWGMGTPESLALWNELLCTPVASFKKQTRHWKAAFSELELFLRTKTDFALA